MKIKKSRKIGTKLFGIIMALMMVFSVTLVAACAGTDSGALTGVNVSGATNVTLGSTISLTATPQPNTPENRELPIAWSSSNDDIATVDSAGRVTGVALGPVTITATIGAFSGTRDMTVVPLNVSTITLDPDGPLTMLAGDSVEIEYTITPANATFPELEWSSSNDEIAAVEVEDGVVTVTAVEATDVGSAIITATTTAPGNIITQELVVNVAIEYPDLPLDHISSVDFSVLPSSHWEGNLSEEATELPTLLEQAAPTNGDWDAVSTAAEFLAMTLDGQYYLANDIDFENANITPIGGFGRIGYGATAFTGVFDGRGFTLSNFNIVNPNATSGGYNAQTGLFAVIGNSAGSPTTLDEFRARGNVRNLAIVGASVTGGPVGILAGQNYGVIENVFVEGSINTTLHDWRRSGGIISANEGGGLTLNVISNLTEVIYNFVGTNNSGIGGISGWNQNADLGHNNFWVIDNLPLGHQNQANSTTATTDDSSSVRLFTPSAFRVVDHTEEDDDWAIDIGETGAAAVGTTVTITVTVDNDAFSEDLSRPNLTVQVGAAEPQVLRPTNIARGADETTITYSILATAQINILDFELAEGEWTAISTAQEFFDINQNLDGFYYLADDIDFENVAFTSIGWPGPDNPAIFYSGAFTGIFDGRGHTLSNISLGGHWNVGIFSRIDGPGVVRNLHIDGATIQTHYGNGGILFGRAYHGAVIENILITNSTVGNGQNTDDAWQSMGGLGGHFHHNSVIRNVVLDVEFDLPEANIPSLLVVEFSGGGAANSRGQNIFIMQNDNGNNITRHGTVVLADGGSDANRAMLGNPQLIVTETDFSALENEVWNLTGAGGTTLPAMNNLASLTPNS